MIRLKKCTLTLTCLMSMLALASAQSITVGIEEFADLGINARMSVMTTDPSDRLFVNDQRGGLYHVDRNSRVSTLYLDLSDDGTYPSLDLVGGFEPGFQSFAFHPDFATSGTAGFGKFYTMHSSANNTPTPDFDPGGSNVFHSVLLEWQTTDATSTTFVASNSIRPFREVARFQQPFGNHNAGLIAFNSSVGLGDPDRNNLYIAIGDGGSGNDPQNNGQDPSNPFGAILRIDPLSNDSSGDPYSIVGDNVLAADGDANTLGEIFAYGLRNPQRFGWDENGDMYIADIGQGSFEEINLGLNGGNFGWNQREGSVGATPAGFIDPVADYAHSGFLTNPTAGGALAITVGDVVRGGLIPELDGQLLLGDFPNGAIYTLDVDNDPLNGGQDGLHELILEDTASGQQGRLSTLIGQNRVDLRFSYGIPGEVFILNKRDGIIRRLVTLTPVLLGDCDLDGNVTFLDIAPFIAVLSSDTFLAQADCNQDGVVTFLDIAPFIAILGLQSNN